MNVFKYITLSVMVLASLVSCKENMMDEEDSGALVLKVATKMPSRTRIVSSDNTGDFPVSIQGNAGTPVAKVSKSYASVNSIPQGPILLPIGYYTVTAHSPFELKKQMDKPYFAGSAPLEIIKDVTSKATVTCKMKNSKIQLVYTENFKATFASWTITVDDGTGSVMSFTEADLNPAPIYYFFGDNGAAMLNVNIIAKTKTGNTIRDSRSLTKSQAGESYEDDSPNFTGGDGLNLNMDISGTPTGNVSIQIGVKIEFTDSQEDLDVNVGDKDPEPGTEPDFNGGDQPAGDGPALDLPQNFTYSLTGNPAKPESADAILKTPAGLKSAKVTIVTDNAGFENVLKEAAFDEPGALLTGAELIGNNGIQGLFTSLDLKDAQGQPKKTPMAGEKEYVFPISTFFTFLDMFTGIHEFHIALEDVNGEKVEGVLTITIKE